MCGTRDRNRTGKPCGEGFSSHFGFRRQHVGTVRGLEHAFTIVLMTLGVRRLLSTPSLAMLPRAWLGVGSVADAARAFAEFDGFHFQRFRRKAQIF